MFLLVLNKLYLILIIPVSLTHLVVLSPNLLHYDPEGTQPCSRSLSGTPGPMRTHEDPGAPEDREVCLSPEKMKQKPLRRQLEGESYWFTRCTQQAGVTQYTHTQTDSPVHVFISLYWFGIWFIIIMPSCWFLMWTLYTLYFIIP